MIDSSLFWSEEEKFPLNPKLLVKCPIPRNIQQSERRKYLFRRNTQYKKKRKFKINNRGKAKPKIETGQKVMGEIYGER